MKIAVSACLLGKNCRYDGAHCYRPYLAKLLENHTVIPICPESFGGLTVPREPCEIVGDKVFSRDGKDMSLYFELGVQKCLELIQNEGIELAVLKSKSPSCGNHLIYDGTFSNQLIQDSGLLCKALKNLQIPIIQVD